MIAPSSILYPYILLRQFRQLILGLFQRIVERGLVRQEARRRVLDDRQRLDETWVKWALTDGVGVRIHLERCGDAFAASGLQHRLTGVQEPVAGLDGCDRRFLIDQELEQLLRRIQIRRRLDDPEAPSSGVG